MFTIPPETPCISLSCL